jgi:hypothetical protein
MTDLYQAYGEVEEEEKHPKKQHNMDEDDNYKDNQRSNNVAAQSHNANNNHVISEKFELPKQYAEVPQSNEPKKYYNNARHSYSFWDRMIIKRKEVIKLAIFSLVIVLGISLDRIFTHYITKYIADNVFSDMQELMLRFSYPVLVFLFLWVVKSL